MEPAVTPEEQAVIDAARKWWQEYEDNTTQTITLHNLASAVRALETERLDWVPRTWQDVRQGDTVRLPGTEHTAYVESAVHVPWHVKPGTRATPLEWQVIRVTLVPFTQHDALDLRNTKPYGMDPAGEVEILLAPSEARVIEALGWENRMEVVVDKSSSSVRL
jgi:hypothetical protein